MTSKCATRGTPAIRIDHLALRYRLGGLWRRTISVDEIDVDGVAVTAHPDAQGGLNLAHLTTPSPSPFFAPAHPAGEPARPSAWKIRVERIRVAVVEASVESEDGATARIHDATLDGALALEGERVRARITGLSAAADRDDQAYTLSLSNLSLDLDRHSVKFAVQSLRLTGLLRGEAPLDLQASAAGPLDRIDLVLDITSGAAHVRSRGVAGIIAARAGQQALGSYDLQLNGRGIDPSLLASESLVGQLGFDIHLQGQGPPLSPGSAVRLEVQLLPSTVAGVAIESGRVTASARGDSWEVSPSVIDAPGVSIAWQGHGSGHRMVGDVEVDADGQSWRAHHRGFDGRGRGKIDLHVEGEWPGRVALRAHGGLRAVRAQSLRVGALKLDADVSAEQRAGEAEPAFDARAAIAISGLAVAGTRAASANVAIAAHGTPDRPSGTARLIARHVQAGAGATPIDQLTLNAAEDRGAVRVTAAVSGPRAHGGLRAHGTLSARAADVSLDALSADLTTHDYRQKLDLEGPSRITYRAGDQVTVQHLAIKGVGARFTGQAVISGSYRLPPSRRDPLGRVEVQLASASVGGLTPIDLRMNGTLTRRRADVHLDAQMPRADAQLHLDADVPVVVSSGGTPRLSARGDVTAHLKSNQVRLQSLPAVERVLARAGITGGTASVDLTVTGDIDHPDATGAFDVRDVMYRNIAGLGRDSTLKTVPGLGGSIKIVTKPGDIRIDGQLLIRKVGVLSVSARTPVDLGRLIAGRDLPGLPDPCGRDHPPLLAQVTVGLHRRAQGHRRPARRERRNHRHRWTSVGAGEHHRGGRRGRRREVPPGPRLRARRRGPGAGAAHAGAALGRAARWNRDAGAPARRSDRGQPHGAGCRRRLRAPVPDQRARDRGQGAAVRDRDRLVAVSARFRLAVARERPPRRHRTTYVPGHSRGGHARPRPRRPENAGAPLRGWEYHGKGVGHPRRAERSVPALRGLHGARPQVPGGDGREIPGRASTATWPPRAPFVATSCRGRSRSPTPTCGCRRDRRPGPAATCRRSGPHPDVHFVDQTALAAEQRDREKRRQAAASGFRLAVEASAKPVYIRGKDLDIEVRSDVKIGSVAGGAHAGAPTITGGLHIPRGRINIQGQRFDFDHGNVTFNGSYELDPQLDIKLTRQYPEAMVTIELRGTPKTPQLRMSSDPAVYDQAQIVSLILTGSPGGQPSSGKSFDPTAAVATAVLAKLADQVAPALGLDVMRVEGHDVKNDEGQATGETDTRVEVGKYITERIYLSYAHIFGAPDNANQNEAHVEYRMTRRFMMESIFGDAGQGGLDALWTYRF